MSTYVSEGAIHTWEHLEPPSPRRRWILVAKAQFLRHQYSWVFWSLIAFAVILALLTVLGSFEDMAYDGGIGMEGPTYILTSYMSIMVMIALLLTAAPSVADDIRFDAALFYFSRPLLVRDYLIGKALFVIGLLLILVLPALLLGTVVGIATWGADGPTPPDPGEEYYQQYPQEYSTDYDRWERRMASFEYDEINTFGDWAFASGILLVGTIASVVFLGSLTLYLSSWTTRGWHAATALVVVLVGVGFIGSSLGSILAGNSVSALIWNPAAWPMAVTTTPLEAYFRAPPVDQWDLVRAAYFEGTAGAVVMSHILMAAASFGLLRLTERRLHAIGGAA